MMGTQLVFPISRHLAVIGAFEIDEAELEASEDLVAKVNGSTLIHASRQVYGSGPDFGYILMQDSRMKAGSELMHEPFLQSVKK